MISRLLELLFRTLLETGLLLIVAGLLLCVLAYRTGRRLAVTGPDPLERLSGRAERLLALFPRGNGPAEPLPSEQEQEET